ncbi:NmrA family NAD(P)-binding protein [Halorubellus sp. PRR65]|uniref:NmrA family NAD(P)-binding protein n=1 Tax=Halorubellus sp. PRR65 TaxID=3098148 RepID=UPI002B25A74D|nr:NmrA family NAD(P)-binding protein [Halorubellus sp. PRR65]
MTQKVLVVGATGRQGSAVIDHLLSGVHGDFAVTATTRHPYGARRRVASLKDRGVRVVKGDLDDPASYREHLNRVDAAFLVTSPTDGGADTEACRGRGFVDAAVNANLDHLVYGSAMGANRLEASGVEALSGKQRVETYLEESKLTYTVIRPGVFVQHFERQRDQIEDGRIAWPVEPETLLAVVDVDDVGRVAATAFAHPETYAGVHLDLAGDLLTLSEVAEGFAAVRGHDVVAEHVTDARERERFGALAAGLYAWYDDLGGFRLDPAPLADLDVQPRSLQEALVRTGWMPAEHAVDDEQAMVND